MDSFILFTARYLLKSGEINSDDGRGIEGVMKNIFIYAISVALVIVVTVSSVAYADMPARIEVYARWKQIMDTAAKHFSYSEASVLERKLRETIDIHSSKPLHTAYNGNSEFINLGSGGSLLSGLVELVKPHLSKNEVTKVRAFLDSLNSDKLVQGLSVSRNYSGCLLITYELLVSDKGVYEIKSFHAPFSLPGCELSQSTSDYKGITFMMSTGVPAPAEQRSRSKDINRQKQHSMITFVRQKALWTAESDGSGAIRITSTDPETTSAISPDRNWIAYHVGADPMTGFGRLYRVPTAGGRPEELTIKGFSGAQHPSFSPDGKSIVFVGMSEVRNKKIKGFDAVYATMSIAVLNLQTGDAKNIVSRKNVLLDAGYVYSHPAFSPDNRLIAFQQSGSDVSGGFSVIDLSGRTIFHYPKSGLDTTPYWRPQFSPDRKQILCYSPATSEDKIDTIFMIDMKTGLKQRITEGANPVFVDNGSAIVFERWLNKWSPEGNAKSNLWYLEIREGAQMKKILDDASQPR